MLRAANTRHTVTKLVQRMTDAELDWFIVHLMDEHDAHREHPKNEPKVDVPGAYKLAYKMAMLEWKSRNPSAATFTANERITHGGIAALRAGYRARLVPTPRYPTSDVMPNGVYADAAPRATRPNMGAWDWNTRMRAAVIRNHYKRDLPDALTEAFAFDPLLDDALAAIPVREEVE